MGEDGDWAPLTHAVLCQCLSQIEQTSNGKFAFTRLDCSNKELTHLGNKVENYEQLRHVVLSHNKIQDLTQVLRLPHLLTLRADDNAVDAVDFVLALLPWCQRLDLSGNKLTCAPSLCPLERLRFARFTGNEIASLDGFGGHPVLEELELTENKLATLSGMGTMAALTRLDLTGNELTSLEGLDAPALKSLGLGKNQLASLEHVGGAPRCVSLDLSENQLSGEDPAMPELARLGAEMPLLQALLLGGNPLADDQVRVQALVRIPHLLRVEDEEVTNEDREAARALGEEIAAAAAEAAAAAAAAAAAGEGEEAEEG